MICGGSDERSASSRDSESVGSAAIVAVGVRRSFSVVKSACCGMAPPEDEPCSELSRFWISVEASVVAGDVGSWGAVEEALNGNESAKLF